MEHLYNYSLEELTEYFKSINEKPFRAKQVFQWLYQKNAFDFQEICNRYTPGREQGHGSYEVMAVPLQDGIDETEKGGNV